MALVAVGSTAALAVPPADSASTYIVQFAPGVSRAAEVADARAKGLNVTREFANAFSGMVVTMTPAQAAALSKKPTVKLVEADAPMKAIDTQNGAPWGIDRVDQRALPLDGAYNFVTNPGAGVRAYDCDLSKHHRTFSRQDLRVCGLSHERNRYEPTLSSVEHHHSDSIRNAWNTRATELL